jgi:hypothetical protein
MVIADAALEGDDVTQDSSTNRARINNMVQLFWDSPESLEALAA